MVRHAPPRSWVTIRVRGRHSSLTPASQSRTMTSHPATTASQAAGCAAGGRDETHSGGSVPTIVMRIPKRQEIALDGRRQVSEALRELGIAPETVLVIKGNRLLTRDAWIEGDDVVEVRPVMSGGS